MAKIKPSLKPLELSSKLMGAIARLGVKEAI